MARAGCITVVHLEHRPAFRPAVAAAVLTLATLAPGALAQGDAPEIHLPDGNRPAVLDSFVLPDSIQALAVRPDGLRAAVAVPVQSKGRGPGAEVRVHAVGRSEPVIVPLQGIVRDLLFLDEDPALFAIEHRPAKRREGDSYLVLIDDESGKAQRVMRLPPSARGLAYWPVGRSLLVAARNELRSVTMPLLRSGPLYRVVGENLCIAVAGAGRVLVGQADALLLVDLTDPQGRESMPVRERVPSPAPVLSLALAADGSRGVASLADKRVLSVNLDPLALAERGTGVVVARPLEPVPAPVAVTSPKATQPAPKPSPTSVPAAEPPSPAPVPEPSPAPEPEPPAAEQPVVDAPPPAVEPREVTPPEPTTTETAEATVTPVARPAPAPEPAPPPVTEEPMEASPPLAEAPPDPEPDHVVRVQGRITGPAAAEVVHVVLFGPDNLLREAARVRPAADGRYRVKNLPPGRYSIQLSGGGNRVLVTEPRFRTVEVSVDAPAEADFRVLRAL